MIGMDNSLYGDGRAAITSPPIAKLSNLCSVVFFYCVGGKGRAGLSLYLQTGKSSITGFLSSSFSFARTELKLLVTDR